MNKKQIIKGLVFSSLFLLLLQTVTYIIRTNGNVKERFVGFYAEKNNTVDTIMIGSSPVYPCFNGAQLWGEYGISAYPLSSNRQRPQAAHGLVKEALKTQSPELFIFEVKQFASEETESEDNAAYTRGVTDNMKYSFNRMETINDMVSDRSERYTYYFDIFKYHSNWKTMFMASQLKAFRYEYPNPRKGFVLKDGINPAVYVDYSGITEAKPILRENEETVRRLLHYLRENQIQALFVLAPYELESAEKKMNYNYIEELVNSYGFQYLDFNGHLEEMDFNFEEDFYDGGIHTNAVGSEKCTALLGDYIKENYELADNRGNEKYKTWDAAHELWKQELESAGEKIAEAIQNKEYTTVEEEE